MEMELQQQAHLQRQTQLLQRLQFQPNLLATIRAVVLAPNLWSE